MKNILVTLSFLFAAHLCFSQDTIRVKAFDYSSQTRDTIVNFPNGTDSYRQIIMLYNMRCKGARVSTGANRNLGCGEWDYSCNTYLEDSTRTDSLFATTAEYSIDGFSGTSYNYKETPIYDFYRNSNIIPEIVTSSNLDTFQLGNGTVFSNLEVPSSIGGTPAKVQHLYTSNELRISGLTAGEIWGIITNIQSQNVTISDLRVNMKNVSKDSLSLNTIEEKGLQNVFSSEIEFNAGTNKIQFHSPFVWDGVSSILVELTSSKTISFEELLVQSSPQDTFRSIIARDGNHINFNGTNYAESQSYAGVMGSQNRTCEAWIKTTGANQEIVGWGKNASGQKWVFRTNTDGSLRVEVNGGGLNATTPVNDGKWHHVACVLDGSKVSNIKMYVDGNIEAISATTDLSINTTEDIKLRMSRGINNRYFVGSMDDVRIWDIALSQSEIQELMHKRVQDTDVKFSNLKAYYRFESIAGEFTKDASSTGASLDIYGLEEKGTFRASALFKDYIYSPNRMNIGWLTGDFTVNKDTIYTFDQVAQNSNLVKKNSIIPAYNTVNSDAIVVAEEFERWNADNVETYYDEYGEVLETKAVTADGTIETGSVDYIRRWPSRLEIMSFVTPYGINLDLGLEGKTWTFDMTDFTPILKGQKRMFLSRGGQNQEEMDIEFLFIKGTPSRDVLDIREIWPSQQITANYSQILNNTYYAPIDFRYNENA
ncbi:LamG domain-containing protein, partial [Bacteroidia bacterium]|nr:LamG domain-containing protein [Bacteroidia bacterium]